MTETSRTENAPGEPPHPYAPQPSRPVDPQPHAAQPSGATGSPAPSHAPQPAHAAPAPHPPYAPAAGLGAPLGGPVPAAVPAAPAAHGRPRARRSLTLVAAVALAAGVIGGGAGALAGNATDHRTQSTASASAVNASAVDGTVAGVVRAVGPSVVEVDASSASGKSTGAGVIITSDGEVVTNNHVIAGAQTIGVTYRNGRTATAEVVGTDARKDLALLRIKGASGLPAAVLGDSSAVAVGDQVVAIGSPDGLTGTVTSGIVSALGRDVTVPTDENRGRQSGGGQWPFSFGGNQYNGDTGDSTTTYKAIQTDASLNPGNSGGALIAMNGQVIGINSAMYSNGSGGGSASAGSVGLGFAIPIATVKADLATLRAGGTD